VINAVNSQAPASSLSGSRAEKPDAEPQPRPSDGKGPVDPQAAVVKISAEGAKRAEASSPPAPSSQPASGAADATALVDSDGDGKATHHEFRDGAPKTPQTRVTIAQAAPAGGSVGLSPVGSSSQVYDPADGDGDGKVSARELQAYDAKLAIEKAAQATASSSSAAVKAYAAVEQLSQAGGKAAAA